MPFESETGSAPGTDFEPVGERGSRSTPRAERSEMPLPEPDRRTRPDDARAPRDREARIDRPTRTRARASEVDPAPPATEPAVRPGAERDSAGSTPDGDPSPTHRIAAGKQRRRREAAPVPARPDRRRPVDASAAGRMAARRGPGFAVVLIIVVLMGSLWGLALGINAFARWNARRIAAHDAPATADDREPARHRRARRRGDRLHRRSRSSATRSASSGSRSPREHSSRCRGRASSASA